MVEQAKIATRRQEHPSLPLFSLSKLLLVPWSRPLRQGLIARPELKSVRLQSSVSGRDPECGTGQELGKAMLFCSADSYLCLKHFIGLQRQTQLQKRRLWCWKGMHPFTQVLANLSQEGLDGSVFLEEGNFQKFKQVLVSHCLAAFVCCRAVAWLHRQGEARDSLCTRISSWKRSGQSGKVLKSKYIASEKDACCFHKREKRPGMEGKQVLLISPPPPFFL